MKPRKEREPIARLEAAFAQAKAGNFDDAKDVVIACLQHEDQMVRARAAWMLGQIGARWAVEPLTSCTSDPSSTVRNEVILGLLATRSVVGVPSLLRALGDQDESRREDARVALVGLLGRGVSHVLAEMEEEVPDEEADATAWWTSNSHRFDVDTSYDGGVPVSLERWIDQMAAASPGVFDVIADRLTTWTGFDPGSGESKDQIDHWRAWWRGNKDRFPTGRRTFWGHPV